MPFGLRKVQTSKPESKLGRLIDKQGKLGRLIDKQGEGVWCKVNVNQPSKFSQPCEAPGLPRVLGVISVSRISLDLISSEQTDPDEIVSEHQRDSRFYGGISEKHHQYKVRIGNSENAIKFLLQILSISTDTGICNWKAKYKATYSFDSCNETNFLWHNALHREILG